VTNVGDVVGPDHLTVCQDKERFYSMINKARLLVTCSKADSLIIRDIQMLKKNSYILDRVTCDNKNVSTLRDNLAGVSDLSTGFGVESRLVQE
jgi:hypothetical protein